MKIIHEVEQPIEGNYSKNSCDVCRKRRIYCNKEIPTCKQCMLHSQNCTYEFIPKKRGPIKGAKPKCLRESDGELYIKYLTTTNFETGNTKPSVVLPPSISHFHSGKRVDVVLDDYKLKVYDPKKSKQVDKPIKPKMASEYFNSKFSMLHMLFNSSIMDNNQKVYISTTGSMDYYGESPMGLLITMYIVHHSKPSSLNTLHASKKLPPPATLHPITKRIDLTTLQSSMALIQITDMCVKAYFKYCHPQLPFVNKRSILTNFSKHSPVLINIMCSLGSGYLPEVSENIRDWFSDRAMIQLKSKYLECSLDNISALLLMANFQHKPKDCSKGFFSLGYAIRMSYALGLDRDPPPNTDSETKELRNRLWWWCHVFDKLYGFGMNRPYAHDFRFSIRPCPQFSTIDFVKEETDKDKFTMVCACLYTKLIGEFCQLFYLMVRKFKFSEQVVDSKLEEVSRLAKATTQHLSLMNQKVINEFDYLVRGKPSWTSTIASSFRLNLQLVFHAALIQLCRTFSKAANQALTADFHKLATESADKAIDAAVALGNDFYMYGTTYRFYAFGHAVFYQILNATSKDKKLASRSLVRLKQALKIYDNSKLYYALGTECLHMSLLLCKAENIDLSDEFYSII